MLLKSLLKVIGQTGANILFPTPNYLLYEAQSSLSSIEVCHFNILLEKCWEVDFMVSKHWKIIKLWPLFLLIFNWGYTLKELNKETVSSSFFYEICPF